MIFPAPFSSGSFQLDLCLITWGCLILMILLVQVAILRWGVLTVKMGPFLGPSERWMAWPDGPTKIMTFQKVESSDFSHILITLICYLCCWSSFFHIFPRYLEHFSPKASTWRAQALQAGSAIAEPEPDARSSWVTWVNGWMVIFHSWITCGF